jgi:hypothetical protein
LEKSRKQGEGNREPGFRVQGSGFRVQGSGFRVQGSGHAEQGIGDVPSATRNQQKREGASAWRMPPLVHTATTDN